jgi:hypothetical protein
MVITFMPSVYRMMYIKVRIEALRAIRDAGRSDVSERTDEILAEGFGNSA